MKIYIEYEVGDKVLLPLNETGTITKIHNIPWGFKYKIRIRKSTLNKTNQILDFKYEQLTPEF